MRLEQLHREYTNVLDKEANLYDCSNDKIFSNPEKGPFFLGSTAVPFVMSVLGKSAKDIHRLQKELQIPKEHTLEEIVQANNIISPAETASEILLIIDFNYKPCLHAAAKAVDASHKLDNILLGKINVLEKEFCRKYGMMMERRHVEKSLRSEFSGYFENFNKLKGIYLSRSLPEKDILSIGFTFAGYGEKLKKMQNLEKEIGQVAEEYRNINNAEELNNFFRHFKKRTRNFLFFKGDLAMECLDADYFEGMQKIDELKKEIKQIKANFDYLAGIKNNILEEMAQLEKYSSAAGAIKEGRISVDDLKTLASIKGKLERFDSSHAVKTIYLEGLFKQYNNAITTLSQEVSGLLRNESDRIEKNYRQIEYQCAKILQAGNMINEYIPQAKKLNNELSELQARFEIIGNKFGYENAKKLIGENEKRINEIEAGQRQKLLEKEAREKRGYDIKRLELEAKKAEEERQKEAIVSQDNQKRYELEKSRIEAEKTNQEKDIKLRSIEKRLEEIKKYKIKKVLTKTPVEDKTSRIAYNTASVQNNRLAIYQTIKEALTRIDVEPFYTVKIASTKKKFELAY